LRHRNPFIIGPPDPLNLTPLAGAQFPQANNACRANRHRRFESLGKHAINIALHEHPTIRTRYCHPATR